MYFVRISNFDEFVPELFNHEERVQNHWCSLQYTGESTKILFSRKLPGVGYTGESGLTGVGCTGRSKVTGVANIRES